MDIEKLNNETELYPKVPTAPPTDEGLGYRLQKINEIQRFLENEREKRESLSKKYHRAVKIVDGIDVGLTSITMGLTIGGLGLLTTIVALPIVVTMEGIALGTGVLSIVGKYVNKKLCQGRKA